MEIYGNSKATIRFCKDAMFITYQRAKPENPVALQIPDSTKVRN